MFRLSTVSHRLYQLYSIIQWLSKTIESLSLFLMDGQNFKNTIIQARYASHVKIH